MNKVPLGSHMAHMAPMATSPATLLLLTCLVAAVLSTGDDRSSDRWQAGFFLQFPQSLKFPICLLHIVLNQPL